MKLFLFTIIALVFSYQPRLVFDAPSGIGPVQQAAKRLDNRLEHVMMKISVGAVNGPFHLLNSGSSCRQDVPWDWHSVKQRAMLLLEGMELANTAMDVNAHERLTPREFGLCAAESTCR